MAKKIWKVNVIFVDEAPADGERILKDVKTLLEYDRIHGGFGKMPYYWYGIETGDDDGIYPVMVETRRRVKNKALKRMEIKREFRTVRIKAEFLNREWRTVMTKSGIPVHYAVAV
jgi:hypothetical protein